MRHRSRREHRALLEGGILKVRRQVGSGMTHIVTENAANGTEESFASFVLPSMVLSLSVLSRSGVARHIVQIRGRFGSLSVR